MAFRGRLGFFKGGAGNLGASNMLAGFLLAYTTTLPGGLVQFPVMARLWPCKGSWALAKGHGGGQLGSENNWISDKSFLGRQKYTKKCLPVTKCSNPKP